MQDDRDRPSADWFPHRVQPSNLLEYWLDVPARFWPELAAHWLVAGFDSEQLVGLASRSSGDAVTTDEMLDVLRSLGVTADSVAGFMTRCERAVREIQLDLDATGFGRYRMTAANASGGEGNLPCVYAAVRGRGWCTSGEPMTIGMDDETLLEIAAASVSDTVVELDHVVWPVCPIHDGPPMVPRAGTWFCERGEHVVAPLGGLRGSVTADPQP